MASQYLWRISKYDPAKRDAEGRFLGDEWTCFTEVDQVINGRLLTYDEYYDVESKYVEAVIAFIDSVHADGLEISELSFRFQNFVKSDEMFRDIALTPEAIVGGALVDGETLPRAVWADVIRLTLRDGIWCKLNGPRDFKIRFGWDFCVYVSSPTASLQSVANCLRMGLFAESGAVPEAYQ